MSRFALLISISLLFVGPLAADYIAGMPYFHQYSNRINPGGSCQNTCIAMVLKHYGAADITPDKISAKWGTFIAQTTTGLESIFNEEAALRGLRVRDRSTEDGTLAELHASLDAGRPVIVHGGFSEVGHLLVLVGYDERYYYVLDPASKWSERVNGGFTHTDDAEIGRYTRYGRAAVENAIVSSDHRRLVRMHLLYFTEAALMGEWQEGWADSLVAGESLALRAGLRVLAAEPGDIEAVADLSELGGGIEVLLQSAGDGLFRIAENFAVTTAPGRHTLRVHVRQGQNTALLERRVVVVPRADAPVLADELVAPWQQGLLLNAETRMQGNTAAEGARALAVEASSFTLEFTAETPFDLAGYRALRFAFHPGSATVGLRPAFSVQLNGDVRKIESLLGDDALAGVEVDLEQRAWQIVELPLWAFNPLEEPLHSIRLFGNLRGTFYLDDMRLLSARFPAPQLRAAWQRELPDTLLAGSRVLIERVLHVSSTETDDSPLQVFADLSALGGEAEWPLRALDAGRYQLRAELLLQPANGRRSIVIYMRQQGKEKLLSAQLEHDFIVVPEFDQPIFDEGYSADWQQGFTANAGVATVAQEVYRGELAQAVDAEAFTLEYLPRAVVEAPGYRALHFAFHPGDSDGGARPVFNVMVNGDAPSMVSLLQDDELAIDLEKRIWQIVEIPLTRFYRLDEPIRSLRLLGNLRGRFYIDDMRLVAAAAPRPTAVVESVQGGRPRRFSLAQNVPNPFNGDTVIRFSLAERQPIRLEIFNISGQRVALLREGEWAAGVHVTRWDGRDDNGQAVATGLYFYRLTGQGYSATKKLLLLR